MLIAIAPYSTEQTNGNIRSEWQERIGRWHHRPRKLHRVDDAAFSWRRCQIGRNLFFLTSMAPNQCVLAEGGLLFRPDAAATDAAPACPAGSFIPCHGSKFDLAGRVFKNPGTGEAGGDAASLFVGSYVEHCDMRQAKPKSARLVAAAAPDQVRLRLCPRHSYEWPHKIRTSP